MHILTGLALALLLVAPLAAEQTPEELAAESIAYCQETEKDAAALTPQMVIEKVDKGAALVAEKGPEAFPAFKGKGSEFLFAGTYIWIHDEDGVMHMHPIKHKMEGRPFLNLKDQNGKMIFLEMNKIAMAEGSGWVEYVWPKPGEKEVATKVSYVKAAKHGDKTYIVGCGVYDWTLEKVQAALKP